MAKAYPHRLDYVVWNTKHVDRRLVEVWKGFRKDLQKNTLVFGFLIDKDVRDVADELEKKAIDVNIRIQK